MLLPLLPLLPLLLLLLLLPLLPLLLPRLLLLLQLGRSAEVGAQRGSAHLFGLAGPTLLAALKHFREMRHEER